MMSSPSVLARARVQTTSVIFLLIFSSDVMFATNTTPPQSHSSRTKVKFMEKKLKSKFDRFKVNGTLRHSFGPLGGE